MAPTAVHKRAGFSSFHSPLYTFIFRIDGRISKQSSLTYTYIHIEHTHASANTY